MKERPVIQWKCTTEAESWVDMPHIEYMDGVSDYHTANFRVSINPGRRYQVIDGWGGCFNEKSWDAMSVLSPSDRDRIIRMFFDAEKGCKLNICRTPIGASDYALDNYTYNDTPRDFLMSDFSIDRDRCALIPYIKAAKACRPDLKLWAVPWVHPKWLEDPDGRLTQDPAILSSYALYFSKYVQAYQAEGLNLFCVMPCNEPCWDDFWGAHHLKAPGNAALMHNLVKNYLIPQFKKDQLDCELWLGSFPIDAEFNFVTTMMSDPDVAPTIKGAGYQWWADRAMRETHEHYPQLKLMQTETACNLIDMTVKDLAIRQNTNDWAYAWQQWSLFRIWLEQWANSYMLWNLVLDETGCNNSPDDPWPQCSPVVVNKKTREITVTPMFYAFKHFSFYIAPGAYRIHSEGDLENSIAFQNPNGDIILEIANHQDCESLVTFYVDGKITAPVLPARSWNTFVFPHGVSTPI